MHHVRCTEMKYCVGVQLESMKMDPSFLSRNVNEGFSGGEKKRNEILQLAVLEPDVAILDEIDSGLDVDALKDVSSAVNGMRYRTAFLKLSAIVD
jgi:Fe-S cluster assembly ATP-binding protein